MQIQFSNNFELPNIPSEKSIRILHKLMFKIQKQAHGSTLDADKLKKHKERIYAALEVNTLGIHQVITTGRDLRVAVQLWQQEDGFFDRYPPNVQMIEQLPTIKPRPGSLLLIQLAQLFFTRFDTLSCFESLAAYLVKNIRAIANDDSVTEFGLMGRFASDLFDRQGPLHIAKTARKEQKDLDIVLREKGLAFYHHGKYQELCKNYYYLEDIAALTWGDYSPVLDEVRREVISKLAFEDGLLGHQVIRLLIDKALERNEELPKNWQQVILDIAGDPRVPGSSESYRCWWAPIGSKYLDAFRSYLSGLDLQLFLEAMEEYAKSPGKTELERMFPARKRFLRGLLEKKLVINSRLFLGWEAERFLKRGYKKEELPSFARLEDPDKCILYLKLQNCEIIEGSHNFKMWIYDRIPAKGRVLDYAKTRYGLRELGAGLSELYTQDSQAVSKLRLPIGITHSGNANLVWQNKAIEALQAIGVDMRARDVMDSKDHLRYKRIYGIY